MNAGVVHFQCSTKTCRVIGKYYLAWKQTTDSTFNYGKSTWINSVWPMQIWKKMVGKISSYLETCLDKKKIQPWKTCPRKVCLNVHLFMFTSSSLSSLCNVVLLLPNNSVATKPVTLPLYSNQIIDTLNRALSFTFTQSLSGTSTRWVFVFSSYFLCEELFLQLDVILIINHCSMK